MISVDLFSRNFCCSTLCLQADSSEQLDNVTKLRICHFSYTPEYAATVDMATPHNHCRDVGLIAQELQEVMPDAVQCNVCMCVYVYVYVYVCFVCVCCVCVCACVCVCVLYLCVFVCARICVMCTYKCTCM